MIFFLHFKVNHRDLKRKENKNKNRVSEDCEEKETIRQKGKKKKKAFRSELKKNTVHYGQEQPRIQTEVLGHSLVRLLVRSYRSLVRLLRTARVARALRCAHSFARSLTSLTPSLVGKRIFDVSKWPGFVP